MHRILAKKRELLLLRSENIFLRELQSSDANLMFQWENNPENWIVSGTKKPFTKMEIEGFVHSDQNIVAHKQIRYIICLESSQKPIGTIDLFEFDESKKSVGVGILIADDENRNKGYARETINLMIAYCRNKLNLVTIFCNILGNNTASVRLFENCGFQFVEERNLDQKKVNYYELRLLHV